MVGRRGRTQRSSPQILEPFSRLRQTSSAGIRSRTGAGAFQLVLDESTMPPNRVTRRRAGSGTPDVGRRANQLVHPSSEYVSGVNRPRWLFRLDPERY